MNIQDAKQYILTNSKGYFQKARRKGHICPICGSGSGKDGSGILSKDGVHFTCFGRGHCFTNADVFQIYGQEHGINDFMDQLKGLCSYFHIVLDENPTRPDYKQPYKTLHNTTLQTTQEETDYTTFFKQANQHLKDTTYHRGISTQTLNRFRVGYVKNWVSPTAEKKVPSDRLIIPTSKYSYIARATDPANPVRVMKEGKTRLFNIEALTDNTQPTFIVEGEIDALSIIDLGHNAVGLGGLGNITKLLQEIEAKHPSQPLIIALDNDEAGKEAQEALKEQKAPINAFMYFTQASTLYGPEKDANGALQANKDHFQAALQAESVHAAQEAERLANEVKEAYRQKNSVFAYMDTFYKQLLEKPAKPIPTGFTCLDKLLDGGLYAGLYVVGAVSSLGKSTFCLQIADQIAKNGHDVLIFSLEMGKRVLIAKSVSRLTYLETRERGETDLHASTARKVLRGFNEGFYSEKQRELIKTGLGRYYGEYANRLFITEGNGQIGVKEIQKQVAEFMQIYKTAPVVIVDYLQILAPADVRATDKQNTDRAITTLACMSRDFNIPILGISSFNRENYTTPANLASFKESGAIEYSTDVLIGLQYEGMDYQAGEGYKNPNYLKRVHNEVIKPNEELARKGQPVNIEVKLLKGRLGSKGRTVLQFVPKFNCFIEKEQAEEAPEESGLYN